VFDKSAPVSVITTAGTVPSAAGVPGRQPAMTQMMRPTLTTSTFEGVGYLRLAGEIDMDCAEELRQLGEGLITDYIGTVRVDLSGVTFLDSSGLNALISIRNKGLERGCVLILEKPAPNVLRIFELTALTDVFTIEAG
jgi:anti-sigma B factor antagonist